MRKRWVVGIGAILSLVVAGTGFSSGTGSSEPIFACLNTASGTLSRVSLGQPSECPKNQVVIQLGTTEHSHAHGELAGLLQDDHKQYLPVDPDTRALVTDLDAAGHKITDLAPGTESGEAVSYEQAVKVGDPAGGDLGSTFPAPTVAGLLGRPLANEAPSPGDALIWDGTAWRPARVAFPTSLTADLDADGHKISNLGQGSRPGEAVTFEQVIRVGTQVGGDLSGPLVGPTVTRLQGRHVAETAPAVNDVLTWNGSQWRPHSIPTEFTSPDGRFSLSVSNAGISLAGPEATVRVSGSGVTVGTSGSVTITGSNVTVNGQPIP